MSRIFWCWVVTQHNMAVLPVKKFYKVFSMFFRIYCVAGVLCLLTVHRGYSSDVPNDLEAPFEALYTAGVRAYREDRWFECYSNIKNAISTRTKHEEKILGCRKFCQDESMSKESQSSTVDLAFYEIALRQSDCLRRCSRTKGVASLAAISSSVTLDFEKLTQYDYLQICAYKIERYEDAAAAAYTFLVANPDHENMQSNIEYYKLMPEIKDEYFIDLERKTYQDPYDRAIELYNDEKYRLVPIEMEIALAEFYKEAEKCRLLCENSYDHESLPYLYNAIADHWVKVLRCRQECEIKLATLDGEKISNFLPQIYNYLQFSYYKNGDMTNAVQACQSYLLFDPENTQMLNNRKFYMDELEVAANEFVPRQDATTYHGMLEAEKRMIDIVTNDYTFSDADLDSQGIDIPDSTDEDLFRDPYGNSPATSPLLKDNAFPHLPLGERTEAFLTTLRAFTDENSLEITQEADDLQGPTRVLVDNLLTEEECATLVQLAQKGGAQGEDRSSAHTDSEQHLGVAISSATQLTVAEKISTEMLQTYLRASQASRTFMEKYNNLQVPLHFQDTRIVCRTASEGEEGRDDLSHPMHADNCVIQEDGSCLQHKLAHTMRDFSAFVYLNEDSEGGEFYFANTTNQTLQLEVAPKCGRMVGFESGTYRGIKAVTEGTRCALVLAFTLDTTQQEVSHREAQLILRGMISKHKPLQNPELKKMVDDNGYDIIMTESELNGPERFAADNVISPEMCQSLIDLTVTGAVENDGYTHKGALQSPESPNEGYKGLTLDRAAKLAESKKIGPQLVHNFLQSSRDSMHLVEKYFNLSTPLYFDYTHLVCRTARNDANKDRKDLSHPIHSDNCLIKADGSCLKERPAYIQRDYSALLYLNGDFDGGEFIFTDTDFSIQATLKPTCGRLVGFNASNYHGVKAVLRGRRCALAMWYTLDPLFNEAAHGKAQNVLTKLKFKPQIARDEL